MTTIEKLKERIRKNKILYTILKIPYFPFKLEYYLKNHKKNQLITKENFLILEKIVSSEENVFYFGVPRHLNIGDMAQTYSTKKWINKNYPNKNIITINTAPLMNKKFIEALKEKVIPSNLIFVQSGYCSHEKHPDHKMHKNIVSEFRDNKIIILPQTVNIKSSKELQRTANIYNAHKKLIFISRDPVSFDMIKDAFVNTKLLVYPDIVNTLIGTMKEDSKRMGILLCLRNDYEKYYYDEDIKKYIIDDLSKLRIRIDQEDTTVTGYDYNHFYNQFDEIFSNTLKSFASYEVIITDRYHGTIFSAIANTPVIVLETKDHKVKSGAEWFVNEGYKSVYFAKSLVEAKNIAIETLESKSIVNNENYFNERYYDQLKSEIDGLRGE